MPQSSLPSLFPAFCLAYFTDFLDRVWACACERPHVAAGFVDALSEKKSLEGYGLASQGWKLKCLVGKLF